MSKQKPQHVNYSLPRVRPKEIQIVPYEERSQIYGTNSFQHANTVGHASGFGIVTPRNPNGTSSSNLHGPHSRISVQDLLKTFDEPSASPTNSSRKSFPKSPSTPSFGQYNNTSLRRSTPLNSRSPSVFRQSTPTGTLPRSFVFPPNKHSPLPTSRRFDPQQRNSNSPDLVPTPTGSNTFAYKLKPHSKSFLINEDEPPLANYSPPPPLSPTNGRSSTRIPEMFPNKGGFATMPRSYNNTPGNTQLYSVPNKPQRANNVTKNPNPPVWNSNNPNIQMPLSNPFPIVQKFQQSTIQEGSPIGSRKKSLYQNKPSILLSNTENRQVFDILGPNRQTLSTAVVQVFLPSETDRRNWKIRDVGILCFVRDPTKRSYFLEVLSLRMNRSILVQEIYEEFDYNLPLSRFLTFEGDMYCVGISFANETEAQHFKDILDQKISAKRKRRYERQSKVFEHQKQQSLKSSNQNQRSNIIPMTQHDMYNTSTASLHKPMGFLSPAPVIHSEMTLQPDSKSKKKNKKLKVKDKPKKANKKGKGKIDKNSIGTPSNFQHVSHAGFDQGKGFTTSGVTDEKMLKVLAEAGVSKKQLEEAGVSKKQLEDPANKQFIYEFVEDYNRKSIKRAPPPPPSLTKQTTRSNQVMPAPAPPKQKSAPERNNNYSNLDDTYVKPPAPQVPSNQNTFVPPPPPPMPANISTGCPPPPPPPIPQINYQEPYEDEDSCSQKEYIPPELQNDARSNLLEQIKQIDKGTLRKVDPNATLRKPTGGLSDLLSEIRSGDGYKSLRKVTESPTAARSLESMNGGLAGALARALAERSHAINPESSDSEVDSINSDDEWGDD